MPTEHLQGIVERVTYHAEDSGYTVARLKAPGVRDLVTIVGRFPDIHAGQSVRLTGYWREHVKYGQQYQVIHAQETKPDVSELRTRESTKRVGHFSLAILLC